MLGSQNWIRQQRWQASRPPEKQLSSGFLSSRSCLPALLPTLVPTANVSPNLLPTQGNSDSLRSSDFPISRSENKNGTPTPLRLDALKEAAAYLSPKLGLNQQILLHSTDTLSSGTDCRGRIVRS